MKVRLSEDADGDVLYIDTWWRENRPAAPNLFTNELENVLTLLATSPEAGEEYKTLDARPVRRTLLSKTRRYVYHYRQNEQTVLVIAIWGTQRGDEPPLHLR